MSFILTQIGLFYLWTLVVWVMHYLAHHIPWLWKIHSSHHREVYQGKGLTWEWPTIFYFLESWTTTLDFAIQELFPAVLMGVVFGAWWILIWYYIWTAFIQDWIRHNDKFDCMPFITSGRYHLGHHSNPNVNYGLFTWFWDWLFGTYKYDYRK